MKYASLVVATTVSILSACSPPADPVGRGAAHFEVDQPLAADLRAQGHSCGLPGVGGIGAPKAESNSTRPGPPDLPTAGSDAQPINMGSKVSDGQAAGTSGNYKVECTVSGSSSYTIKVDMAGPNTSEFARDGSGATSVRLTGTINAATGEGAANVYVRTTETSAVSPNRICQLQVLTDLSDASVFRIEPGAVDMVFVCQDTTPATDDFSRCETRGTISLDHCLED